MIIMTIYVTEQSQSDSVQELVESRRQNFLAEAERRANIAKERALGLPSQQKKSSDDVVFRAVPVSVVAEPTLSMSASAGIQRGRSPARTDKAKITTKTEQSVKDKKKSFEAKEAEMNRALQPRGKADSGSRHADAGTRPSDKGTRAKDTGSQPKTFTAPDRKKMGALTGTHGSIIIEPRRKETGLQGFRPGLINLPVQLQKKARSLKFRF